MTSLSESFIDIAAAAGRLNNSKGGGFRRSLYQTLTLFVVTFAGAWTIYHYQTQVLPKPLTVEEAGKGRFSEEEAFKHVKALTQWGPHPTGSDVLPFALQYVQNVSEEIKRTASEEVEVEVDFFSPHSGFHRPVSGRYQSKTLVYSDLHHVVLRISPKHVSSSLSNEDSRDKAILVSAHVDTVFSAEGAGDDSSSVAVMLELARGLSQSTNGFKSPVVFLFNTGEEEGLNGAHSFITQHPWKDSLKLAINLDAMGIGGKSGIFQAGPDPFAVENFAKVAKYPSAQIASQDLFSTGVIQYSTDFEIYREIGGLSGLDFAFIENTAVYHTKNDKSQLLTPGSLQHLGENLLPFLLESSTNPSAAGKVMDSNHNSTEETVIYFDILGKYMVVFHLKHAQMVYKSVIILSILIWATSVILGGSPAAISFLLSVLSLVLTWLGSIGFASVVAFILPSISKSPIPFVSTPWLVLGLYGAPALAGALIGQHVGFLFLRSYLTSNVKITIAELESEKWIFKAGFLQWLILLILGDHYQLGSTYLALVWLVSPALSYFLIEVSLPSEQSPKPLNPLTLLVGLLLPFILTSGVVFMLTKTVIGYSVRYDNSNPGSTPEWMMHIIVAILIAAIVCLTLVHLLSYVHISGAIRGIILTSFVLFILSISPVFIGLVPGFTDDISRPVNLVLVIDNRGLEAKSFVSLFSTTPGKLDKVAEEIGGLTCGKDKTIDFVTFSVNYSCWTNDGVLKSYKESHILPQLLLQQQHHKRHRIKEVAIDTRNSTRWAIGINAEEVKDIELKVESGILIPKSGISGKDGWHIIQFAGGKNSPTKFNLTLFRRVDEHHQHHHRGGGDGKDKEYLVKMRTDHDKVLSRYEKVFAKLPSWCSQYGKSTFPHSFSVLTSLATVQPF